MKKQNEDLSHWNPNDEIFWETKGKHIAYRNLIISMFSLLSAFAVWLYWSIITVEMKNLHYPFDTSQLFALPAIAGFVGATLRIPNAFIVGLFGGRNVTLITTLLLLIPSIGTGLALRDITTPYTTYVVLAALSGIGGGAFASSMSNIGLFFPKKMQGTILGLNAGFGNLGLSVMQFLLPIAMIPNIFWFMSSSSDVETSRVHIENCGFLWVPILVVLAIAIWFGMNNLPSASRYKGSNIIYIGRLLAPFAIGLLTSGIGLYLLMVLKIDKLIVLPFTIILTLFIMKASPDDIKVNLKKQYTIFRNKHHWIMTCLYTMTFGSFIGYTVAFPLLIDLVFGYLLDGSPNPKAPNPFAFAWLGPLVGSLARPLGGLLSDKLGGARVTKWNTVIMIAATLGVAHFIKLASAGPAPEIYFFPFLILFLVLFTATGIGNGSTFRMIAVIFEADLAGPVLGWSSAVSAYGAFIIPIVFADKIKSGHAEQALYSFAFFYMLCLSLIWYYYARKNAEKSC